MHVYIYNGKRAQYAISLISFYYKINAYITRQASVITRQKNSSRFLQMDRVR